MAGEAGRGWREGSNSDMFTETKGEGTGTVWQGAGCCELRRAWNTNHPGGVKCLWPWVQSRKLTASLDFGKMAISSGRRCPHH